MMRSNSLNYGDVLRIVRRWADSFKTESAAARSVGIARQTLNEMTNGKKPFSERVLNAAGIKRFQPPTEYYLMDEI
ncbi:hypothetical protein AA18889_2463 [Acetobacter senegalensis DSM 18889]|nr:hypothetical protein AA18889_2463 [Acetobacter senegalensis DSM 18889]